MGILIIFFTVFSKILGLIRDIVLSSYYGISIVSDAYILSVTVTSVFFILLISAISTAFIPVFRKIENERNLAYSYYFTNNLINIYLIGSILFCVLLLIYTEPVVKVFGAGLTKDALEMTIEFTRISLFSIVFLGVINIYTSLLNLHNKFLLPVLLGIPLNIITIIFIYLSFYVELYYLPLGLLVSSIIQFLIFIPALNKLEYRYDFSFNLKEFYIKDMAIIAIPLLIGMSVNQLNIIIDRSMATSIQTGGVSALNYSNKLIGFVQGVFVYSVSSLIFPQISKLAIEKRMKEFKEILNKTLYYIIYLMVPMTFGFLFYSQEITSFVFGRGAFNYKAIELTSSTLFYYSIGLIGIGLREILTRAFLSLQDSKTPMINGIYAVGINIFLNIVLSRFLGVGGLALASSLSAIITIILLTLQLQKKIGGLVNIPLLRKTIFITCLSFILVLISKSLYLFGINFINEKIMLIFIPIIAIPVYLLLSLKLHLISKEDITILKRRT